MGEPSCNQHGVYEAQERLVLARDTKGWRGLPTAEIEMCQLPEGWLWATSFQLMQGDCCGSASPLSLNHGRLAPSREVAIEAAVAHLSARMAKQDGQDARRIVAWLETLQPDQLDLFASLAA